MSFSTWKITGEANEWKRLSRTSNYEQLAPNPSASASTQPRHEPPNYSSRSGPHNMPKEPPKNYRAVTEEEQKEYLRRMRPREDLPIHPNDPYPVVSKTDLQTDDIVWYRHTDGNWHLARVLRFIATYRVPKDVQVMANGEKIWEGLTRGLDPRNPYVTRCVYLIPGAGNAKPYNWYTRLLLRCWNLIPLDDEELEKMVQHFVQTVNAH